MKLLILKILKTSFVNHAFRFSIYLWTLLDNIFRRFILNRMQVSGTVKLQVDELKFKMYSNWDDQIVRLLYFEGLEYAEWGEVRLFKELSKQSKTVLDVGANTGLYSLISKLSNPDLSVYAFEPYLFNLNRLKKNIALNRLTDQIEIIDKAVGDSNSEIEFAVPEVDQICDTISADIDWTNKFYRDFMSYKNIKFQQMTLDEFVAKEKITSIDLIKIDVENCELNVFKGALNLLSKHSPIIQVEMFVDSERAEFYESTLKPLGYYCYLILKEGLIRTESLVDNPDCRNFIFSKQKSSSEYLSFSNLSALIDEIKPSPNPVGSSAISS